MNIQQAIIWAKSVLTASDTAVLDARVLLCHVLECNQTYLHTWPDKQLEQGQLASFRSLVDRRVSGEPIAYIVGYQEFWSLRLMVNENTLIPRPETELIIETLLTLDLPENTRCLDLGTGTGAIALAIASEKPAWQIVGCDRVKEAVSLAEANRQALNFTNVNFVESNWFAALPHEKSNLTFDLIVSNPPYVESHSPFLDEGDVRFEPTSALTSGVDGLDDIRLIINESQQYLAEGGYLMFEHGYQQGATIRNLLKQSHFSDPRTLPDLAGLDRVTFAQK